MQFSIYQFICKKRDGLEHSQKELKFFLQNLETFEQSQVGAWLMAVFLKGMTPEEIQTLTFEMAHSGECIDIPFSPTVDKHSTGGVGDKTSLVLAPVLAASDVYVPMMSGRGLGHTGGTLDKLESITGFNTQLDSETFLKLLKKNHTAMIGQTPKVAPADRILYKTRDVTATVESIPLITASILSKKVAEGTKGLVMDVKTGSGAFMRELNQSKQLLDSLKRVGTLLGLNVRGIISDMNEPLGRFSGHSLEVIECIDYLKGKSVEKRIEKVTRKLGELMLEVAGKEKNLWDSNLASGKAFEKFLQMTKDQGGDTSLLEDTKKFNVAPIIVEVKSKKKGFIKSIEARNLGLMLIEMGGGRRKSTDKIDFGVGFEMLKTIGDEVLANEPVMKLYLRKPDDLLVKFALEQFEISEEKVVKKDPIIV